MGALARPAVLMAAVAVGCLLMGRGGADASSPSQSVTFTNDSGAPASGVVAYLESDAQASVVQTITAGCGAASIVYLPSPDESTFIDFGPSPPPPVPTPVGGAFYNKLIVSWPSACLTPGASVTLDFQAGCGCVLPTISAHEWLPLSPLPGGVVFAPHNDTGIPRSTLHIKLLASGIGTCVDFDNETSCGPDTTPVFGQANLDHNPVGCPTPQVNVLPSLDIDLAWPTNCVQPGDFVAAGFAGCVCLVTSYAWSSTPVGGAVELITDPGSSGKAGQLATLGAMAGITASLAVWLGRRRANS